MPHLHVHVLPRKAGDFANNDEIYDAIDDKANAYQPQYVLALSEFTHVPGLPPLPGHTSALHAVPISFPTAQKICLSMHAAMQIQSAT